MLALALLAVLAPLGLFVGLLRRLRAKGAAEDPRPWRLRYAILTVAFGAAAFAPAWIAEGHLQAMAGIDAHARLTTDVAQLVYAFLVAAPLEQGLKLAAVIPVWRSRHFATRLDGVIYAASAALGFVSAHNARYLLAGGADLRSIARALLAVPAHLFFAAAWGYALGREAQGSPGQRGPGKRLGGAVFNAIWLGAMLFNGIYDHLVFARGRTALLATLPILLCMGVVFWVVARDLVKAPADGPRTRRRFLSALAPPSIGAVRAALWRTERPVMLGWIAFGALVTTGVITAMLAGSVALGHRLGVDFASVDRGDMEGPSSLAPLGLLATAALLAFPFAGYLVARASSTRTVLEPAAAAGLAIAGALVLLGLAAPVAVVFAMAFAPIAFGLACAGAWLGVTR